MPNTVLAETINKGDTPQKGVSPQTEDKLVSYAIEMQIE